MTAAPQGRALAESKEIILMFSEIVFFIYYIGIKIGCRLLFKFNYIRMHSQRRMSPAPASPLPRSAMVQQHSNRMQFISGPSTPLQPIQYVQMIPQPVQQLPTQNYVLKTEEHRDHRIASRGISQEKENINVKGFQSMRLLSEPHQPSLQNYVDSALRAQRDEFLRMFESQHQQIESLKEKQQKLEETETISKIIAKQGQLETLIKQTERALGEFKDAVNARLNQFQRDYVQRKEISIIDQQMKQYVESQLDSIRDQVSRVDLTTNVEATTNEPSVEPEEYTYKQMNDKVTLDTYDMYIKKYEQFNRQVNDYLQNRKLPEHLTQILNNSSSSEVFDNLDQSETSYRPKKSERQFKESPIKVLDNIENKQASPIRVSREEIEKIKFNYQGKMSTIHETECEEDELVYQVDENGYVLDQEGNPLIDNYGQMIQLSQQDIEYFRSRNQLDDIK